MVAVEEEGKATTCANRGNEAAAGTSRDDVEANQQHQQQNQNFLQKSANVALVLMKVEAKGETGMEGAAAPAAAKTIDDEPLEKVKKPLPTVRATQVLLVGLLVSILVMGCVFVGRCPLDPKIPSYLIITGAVGIVIKLLCFFSKERLDSYLMLSFTVLLIAHILGTIWVYRIYLPNFEPEQQEGLYCHRTVYLFAFWLITIGNALLSLFVVISICYMLMHSSFKSF